MKKMNKVPYIYANTTRKQAFGPPQKYQYGDEPVPMVV